MQPTGQRNSLRTLIESYEPTSLENPSVKQRCLELLNDGTSSLERSHYYPGHFTASAWILSPDRKSALFTHHRKLNRWVQLGGHCDGDSDILACALREAQEESGISDFTILKDGLFDIDIHPIPARPGEPSHEHFDLRFLFQSKSWDFSISEESLDLKWIPLGDVPKYDPDTSVLRLLKKSLEI